jgi:hypothetical protein
MGGFESGSAWHRVPESGRCDFRLSEQATQGPKFRFLAISLKFRGVGLMGADHIGRAVFARSNARIVGSNLTEGMDVCVCVYSVFVLSCV